MADSLLVRPLALYAAPLVTNLPLPLAWFAGKVAADVVFYVVAAFGHLAGSRALRRLTHQRVHELDDVTRASRVDAHFDFARDHDVAGHVAHWVHRF